MMSRYVGSFSVYLWVVSHPKYFPSSSLLNIANMTKQQTSKVEKAKKKSRSKRIPRRMNDFAMKLPNWGTPWFKKIEPSLDGMYEGEIRFDSPGDPKPTISESTPYHSARSGSSNSVLESDTPQGGLLDSNVNCSQYLIQCSDSDRKELRQHISDVADHSTAGTYEQLPYYAPNTGLHNAGNHAVECTDNHPEPTTITMQHYPVHAQQYLFDSCIALSNQLPSDAVSGEWYNGQSTADPRNPIPTHEFMNHNVVDSIPLAIANVPWNDLVASFTYGNGNPREMPLTASPAISYNLLSNDAPASSDIWSTDATPIALAASESHLGERNGHQSHSVGTSNGAAPIIYTPSTGLWPLANNAPPYSALGYNSYPLPNDAYSERPYHRSQGYRYGSGSLLAVPTHSVHMQPPVGIARSRSVPGANIPIHEALQYPPTSAGFVQEQHTVTRSLSNDLYRNDPMGYYSPASSPMSTMGSSSPASMLLADASFGMYENPQSSSADLPLHPFPFS
ncbi:hypothetical protein BDQ12DRAFT_731867 [Crucibulum laeve]|uniref:Uncharacterized protein n=1 Tax=Crucibulum laeve TaxID=68775 RepID=A0A5C3MGX5_9AGAR|nr:hypothetical protein BDQ12DRAFT_731867 [Crucibulum laeve]